MATRRAICILACDPRIESGRKPIAGPSSALAHAALLAATVEEMRRAQVDLILAWRGDEARTVGLRVRTVIPQRGRSLAERLDRAFADLHLLGYRQVAVVPADCPALTAAETMAAFDQLEGGAVVVVPAQDGGINALVMAPEQRLTLTIAALPWETRRLHKALIEVARAAGVPLIERTPLDDIDTAEAFVRYLEAQPEGMTARLLRKSLSGLPDGPPRDRRRPKLFGAPFSQFPPESPDL